VDIYIKRIINEDRYTIEIDSGKIERNRLMVKQIAYKELKI